MGRRGQELSAPGSQLSSAFGPQHVECVLQILRVGADDLHLPPVAGVGEGQRAGMQPLAFQPKLFASLGLAP